MRDLATKIHVKRVISPQSYASTESDAVGAIIDRQGFDSLTWVLTLGGIEAPDAAYTVRLEEGDEPDLSDAAAVADADLLGTEALASFTSTDDHELRKIGYIGTKRYVRLTISSTGNAGSNYCYFAVFAILEYPDSKPTINPPT